MKIFLQIMEVPECPVCWDSFDSDTRMPRLLRCGHTVCQLCLKCLPTEMRLGQRCLRCPECRIPCVWRKVQELPKNYILLRVLDSSSDTDRSQSILKMALSFLSDMQYLCPIANIFVVDTIRSQRLLKRKLCDLAKLTCISSLVLLFVPISLAHVLLAWWTAAIGFLILLWLALVGMGFCALIFFVWGSCNIVSVVYKSHKFLFKKGVVMCEYSLSFFGGFSHITTKKK